MISVIDCNALAAGFARNNDCKPIVFLFRDDVEGSRFLTSLNFFNGPVAFFPGSDGRVNESALNESAATRAEATDFLLRNRGCTLITSSDALSSRYIGSNLDNVSIFLKVGDRLSIGSLINNLFSFGYCRSENASIPGEFAIRGCILDIVSFRFSIRIRFDCDEIEKIFLFDTLSQRSQKEVEEFSITSIVEVASKNSKILLDFLVDRDYHAYFVDFFDEKIAKKFFRYNDCRENNPFALDFSNVVVPQKICRTSGESQMRAIESFGFLLNARKICFVLSSISVSEKVLNMLKDKGFKSSKTNTFHDIQTLGKDTISLCVFPIYKSFILDRVLFLNEHDVFGDRFKGSDTTDRLLNVKKILDAEKGFSPGEALIHRDYGIGIFSKMEVIDTGGIKREFIRLEYLKDSLLIPVETINLLTVYGGSAAPDSLRASSWQRRKAEAKQNALAMADKIIESEAIRFSKKSETIDVDQEAYDNFSALFPYDLTDDQHRAIESIFEDISSGHLMNRCLCGDAGSGKTEVAMRATFAIVSAGYQAIVIVPTRILSRQHFDCFSERFSPLGFVVQEISSNQRLSTNTIDNIKSGKTHIVIGTHAVFRDSIDFFNPGILIIDEEHRFGVEQKSYLRDKYCDVHILHISATPIPRTMRMITEGMLDISYLEYLPAGRRKINTKVSDEKALNDIEHLLVVESERGGGVYCVCPRVSHLDEMCRLIKKVLKRVSMEDKVVEIMHGGMKSADITSKMDRFKKGEIFVLVSTTMVEVGIDIPRANSMIIFKSDMFGLSQLYQLRGRVGRSIIQGNVLFLVDSHVQNIASKMRRLEIINQLASEGAGLSVAMHDMDIRGFGNLLGSKQSGNVKEVGIELYKDMLEKALAERRGEDVSIFDQENCTIKTSLTSIIPEEYISDSAARIHFYRMLADIEVEKINDIKEELLDKYGNIPIETENLLLISQCKAECLKIGIKEVRIGSHFTTFVMGNIKNPDRLIQEIKNNPQLFRLTGQNSVTFLKKHSSQLEGVMNAIDFALKISKILA